MGYLTEEFHAVPLLLERICGIGGAVDLNLVGLYLDGLAAAHRSHETAFGGDAGSGAYLLEKFFVELRGITYYLDVMYGRSIVESDERYVLVSSFGPYPSLCQYILTRLQGKEFLNLQSFHNSIITVFS
jgi:hypothetical protein